MFSGGSISAWVLSGSSIGGRSIGGFLVAVVYVGAWVLIASSIGRFLVTGGFLMAVV